MRKRAGEGIGEPMDEYEIDRAFSEDAEEIETLRARVAELEEENGKLKTRDRIRKAAVDRWVPCSDHRDKVNVGIDKPLCQVCRAEQAERRAEWALSSLASYDKPLADHIRQTTTTDGASG